MAISEHWGKTIPTAETVPPSAGPVAIGRFVAPVAGRTLSRGGTAMAGLLSEWSAIAGPSLAAYTSPAKITKAASEPGLPGKTAPSLLHLKVHPARALEVQYQVPQLIERINQTLGFKAVSGLRIIQAPVYGSAGKSPAKLRPVPDAAPREGLNRLDAALARMATGVKTRSNSG
jgi:hypothetical protein